MTVYFSGKVLASLALLVTVLLTSGCAGIAVVHTKEIRFNKFGADDSYGLKSLSIGYKYKRNPTKEEVKKAWGKPDDTFRKGKLAVWQYDNGMNWYGIIPMVGLPIPLVFPLTRSHIDVYFLGDSGQYATMQGEDWNGFCWCPNNEAELKYGFHTLH